jgi:hypothetical protein
VAQAMAEWQQRSRQSKRKDKQLDLPFDPPW